MIVDYLRATFSLTIRFFYAPSGLFLTDNKIVNQTAENTLSRWLCSPRQCVKRYIFISTLYSKFLDNAVIYHVGGGYYSACIEVKSNNISSIQQCVLDLSLIIHCLARKILVPCSKRSLSEFARSSTSNIPSVASCRSIAFRWI